MIRTTFTTNGVGKTVTIEFLGDVSGSSTSSVMTRSNADVLADKIKSNFIEIDSLFNKEFGNNHSWTYRNLVSVIGYSNRIRIPLITLLTGIIGCVVVQY
eukprot:TRINITY_DN5351_c0_g2_i1.p2 TRINITY_DN5351_c0_g2~~TRINITY_DN5351_c0_g2_i1.p2  ORF type:complete len:100 (-),score=8.43 TRINITY_DN5351_c0_g2_i1:97-396(-)